LITDFILEVPDGSTMLVGDHFIYLQRVGPDRKEIAFVSGGDIWTVPSTGGVASLLVSHTANEARPLYSPGTNFRLPRVKITANDGSNMERSNNSAPQNPHHPNKTRNVL
jgi:hypothetical protein